MKDPIKVIELFAGVGGFRLGLEGWRGKSATTRYRRKHKGGFEVVWSNQFEPGENIQHASNVYRYRWPGSDHSNTNLFDLNKDPSFELKEHQMIVGGFPCQDYSVANTLKRAGGIEGEKGVLWWEIHKILSRQVESGNPTKYLMLENVDRLLKSPRGQRGRDFHIMLASLARLGYAVEWRVVNAADYGMPQRRRRVFLLAFHETTEIYERINSVHPSRWRLNESVILNAFPAQQKGSTNVDPIPIWRDEAKITQKFNRSGNDNPTPFANSGLMIGYQAWTSPVIPEPISIKDRKASALRNYLQKQNVPGDFFVPEELVFDTKVGWKYHKGPKSRERIDRETNHPYTWSEGGMELFDDLDKPARTIITSEGGSTPSRSKHLIEINGQYRRLTPVELEQVTMFPANHTKIGKTDDGGKYYLLPNKRAFLMGNALVVGIVERIGQSLIEAIDFAFRETQLEAMEVAGVGR